MKIICTADEQRALVHVLATNMICPFEFSENVLCIECTGECGCVECVSKNIEWETGDGEQE